MKNFKKISGFCLILIVAIVCLQLLSKYSDDNVMLAKSLVTFSPGTGEKVAKKSESKNQEKEEKVKDLKKIDEQLTEKSSGEIQKVNDEMVQENDAAPKEKMMDPKINKNNSKKVKAQKTDLENATDSNKDIKMAEKNEAKKISEKQKKGQVAERQTANQQTNQQTDQQADQQADQPIMSRRIGFAVVTDEEFIEIGHIQEEVKQGSFNSKEGLFAWGLLSDYKNPDTAIRTLGGIPFAIDHRKRQFYKIHVVQVAVRQLPLGNSYSNIGIESTNPAPLMRITRKAYQDGWLPVAHDKLSYVFMFTKDRESYVSGKVAAAFEWSIKNMNLSGEQADSFRASQRLCVEVFKIERPNKGINGVVIPIYFESAKGERVFLSREYYQHFDEEAAMLGIASINKEEYGKRS